MPKQRQLHIFEDGDESVCAACDLDVADAYTQMSLFRYIHGQAEFLLSRARGEWDHVHYCVDASRDELDPWYYPHPDTTPARRCAEMQEQTPVRSSTRASAR